MVKNMTPLTKENGELFNRCRVSAGKMKSSGDAWWWWWLCSNVNVLNGKFYVIHIWPQLKIILDVKTPFKMRKKRISLSLQSAMVSMGKEKHTRRWWLIWFIFIVYLVYCNGVKLEFVYSTLLSTHEMLDTLVRPRDCVDVQYGSH